MRPYDGTAAGAEERSHGPGKAADMGQREDVERSLARQEGHEGREVYAARTVRREGWRARLAHVESLLSAIAERPVHGSKLHQALREVREMLDEMPQIGPSQRAPIEVRPVRESER